MKKLIFQLTCILLFSTIGYAQEKLTVVATASMIADMTKNIAGDKVNIECIVPIGGDPHIYEPTPRDVKLVVSGNLILKNGLTFEGWLNELIANSGTKAKTVRVTEGIIPISSLDYKNSTDPHAWMDLTRGFQYIANIKNALIELDPVNKVYYEARHEAYHQQLVEADQYIMDKIKTIPEERRILITSHDAFQYYGKRYGIRLEPVKGVSTDTDIKTSDVTRLYEVIKTSKIPAVFIESTINPKFLNQLAKDNNIVVGGELFADSIGKKGGSGDSYIKMLKHNTDVIVAALTRDLANNDAHSNDKDGESSPATKWILFSILGFLSIGGFLYMLKNVKK